MHFLVTQSILDILSFYQNVNVIDQNKLQLPLTTKFVLYDNISDHCDFGKYYTGEKWCYKIMTLSHNKLGCTPTANWSHCDFTNVVASWHSDL